MSFYVEITAAGRDALMREYVRRHGVAARQNDDAATARITHRANEIGGAVGRRVALEEDEYAIVARLTA